MSVEYLASFLEDQSQGWCLKCLCIFWLWRMWGDSWAHERRCPEWFEGICLISKALAKPHLNVLYFCDFVPLRCVAKDLRVMVRSVDNKETLKRHRILCEKGQVSNLKMKKTNSENNRKTLEWMLGGLFLKMVLKNNSKRFFFYVL